MTDLITDGSFEESSQFLSSIQFRFPFDLIFFLGYGNGAFLYPLRNQKESPRVPTGQTIDRNTKK